MRTKLITYVYQIWNFCLHFRVFISNLSYAEDHTDSNLSYAEDHTDSNLSYAEDRTDSNLSYAEDHTDSNLSYAEDHTDSNLSYAEDRTDSNLSYAEDHTDSNLSYAEDHTDSNLSYTEDHTELFHEKQSFLRNYYENSNAIYNLFGMISLKSIDCNCYTQKPKGCRQTALRDFSGLDLVQLVLYKSNTKRNLTQSLLLKIARF